MTAIPDNGLPRPRVDAPPSGPPGPRVFVNDPVLISWVIYGFVQAVIAVLLLASVIEEVVGGIIVGVSAAAYAAVSQLWVRPATVPREPLEQLAAAQRSADGTGTGAGPAPATGA